jgi:cell division protein FtsB
MLKMREMKMRPTFITAISNASDDVKKRIKVYINVDATTLAQKLAKEKGFLSVSLANGANRNLIGNRWFQEGAKVAIDENLHRRSADLAAAAKDLNDGFEYRDRAPGELIKRVKALGGSSYPLES